MGWIECHGGDHSKQSNLESLPAQCCNNTIFSKGLQRSVCANTFPYHERSWDAFEDSGILDCLHSYCLPGGSVAKRNQDYSKVEACGLQQKQHIRSSTINKSRSSLKDALGNAWDLTKHQLHPVCHELVVRSDLGKAANLQLTRANSLLTAYSSSDNDDWTNQSPRILQL